VTLVKNDHVVRDAVLDLGVSLWGKPRIASIVFAISYQIQLLEDAIFDVLEKRVIDVATDAQLETLGDIVGEPRYGRTDAEYRVAIRGRILANRSKATRADLLKLLELMRPGVSYMMREGNASIEILSDSTDHDLDREVVDFLNSARAAGVDLVMTAPTDTDDEFQFGPYGTVEASNTKGFSSNAATSIGGKLRFVL
jgi:hypothetical protein